MPLESVHMPQVQQRVQVNHIVLCALQYESERLDSCSSQVAVSQPLHVVYIGQQWCSMYTVYIIINVYIWLREQCGQEENA
jgi:hypothetical protein